MIQVLVLFYFLFWKRILTFLSMCTFTLIFSVFFLFLFFLSLQGLLKGGSKRRVTPLSDISNPLPPNAEWKKILLRRGGAKKVKEYSQAWTITDEPLCKLCQTPCK